MSIYIFEAEVFLSRGSLLLWT